MKILVADDHALFREGLNFLLLELGDDVALHQACNATEATELARAHPDLDLILLDLDMPGLDSFTGLRTLRNRHPDIPVVVVSASEDNQDIRRAMEADASGFIPKSMSGRAMLDILRRILDGETYVPEQADGLSFTSAEDPAAGLTPRQREVLRLMCAGQSNKAIAQTLGMAEGTVKIHVTAILKALNAANRTQAVIMASHYGYG